MALTRVSRHIIDEPFNPTTVSATDVTATNINASGIGTVGTLNVTGNLTVQGTTTTLDTILTEVDRLEVSANSTVAAGIITQTGSGDILNLFDGSTEVFSVADGGNVGINSDAPKAKLDVNGTVNITGVSTFSSDVYLGNDIYLTDGSSGYEKVEVDTNDIRVEHKHIHSEFGVWTRSISVTDRRLGIEGSGDDLLLYANSAEKVRITSAGSVGIGTNNPREKLDISAGRIILDQDYQFTWANGTTNRARIYGDSGNNFIVENGSSNTERFRITSDGKVGINSTTPGHKLEVAYTNDDDGFVVNHTSRGGKWKFASSGSNAELFDVQRYDSANSTFRRYLIFGPDQFSVYTGSTTSATERLRILANGVFDFKDNNINNVGYIALDYIKGDADDDTNITFAGNDVITFKAGSTSPALTINTTQVKVEDDQKFVAGTGNDLQIWSDNTDQYIRGEQNQLIVRSNNLRLQSYLGENYIHCANNNAVSLYYDNSKKLETTTTGAKVTGALEVTQEYPSIRPTLDLNFAATKTLDRRITFTRDSVGTYVDDMGIIKYASNNVPRFDHDPTTGESLGLLIEESRVNYTYNSIISNASALWHNSRGTFTNSTTVTGPDGTTDGVVLFAEDAQTGPHHMKTPDNTPTGTIADGSTVTSSIWVKKYGSKQYISFGLNKKDDGYARTTVDLDTGAVSNTAANYTATSTAYPNGWYRITVTGDGGTGNSRTAPVNSLFLIQNGSSSTSSYTGDGSSGVYVWGPQMEIGSFATSFIPTRDANTVTRTADLAKITGINFTDFYNQNEGTFFIDSAVARGSAYQGYVGSTTNSTANGGPSYNFNSLMSDADNSDILLNIWDGTGSAQAMISIAHPSGNMKAAGAFKNNDFAFSMNGSTVSTDTSGTIDTNQDQLWIGRRPYANTGWLNNSIKRVVYYNKRLPNAQLQGLTQQ